MTNDKKEEKFTLRDGLLWAAHCAPDFFNFFIIFNYTHKMEHKHQKEDGVLQSTNMNPRTHSVYNITMTTLENLPPSSNWYNGRNQVETPPDTISPIRGSFLKMRKACINISFRVFCFGMFPALYLWCGANECLHAHLALHSNNHQTLHIYVAKKKTPFHLRQIKKQINWSH